VHSCIHAYRSVLHYIQSCSANLTSSTGYCTQFRRLADSTPVPSPRMAVHIPVSRENIALHLNKNSYQNLTPRDHQGTYCRLRFWLEAIGCVNNDSCSRDELQKCIIDCVCANKFQHVYVWFCSAFMFIRCRYVRRVRFYKNNNNNNNNNNNIIIIIRQFYNLLYSISQ